MNRRLFGTLGIMAALAVVTLAGCKSDPLSDLDGTPAAVVTDFSYLQLAIGGTQKVTAQVVDGRATPLEIPVTFSTCTNDVTVTADTSYHPVPVTSARALVTAVTANASCVVVQGGGVVDTIEVAVLPTGFAGTPSTTTPQVGELFTLNATTILKFDPALSNIDFGGGITGEIVTRTANVLTVRVPQPDAAQPGALTVTNVDVTYVPGLRVDLATTGTFTVANPNDPNDAPDPAVTLTIPATSADTVVLFDGFKTGEVDNFYSFTLTGSTTFKLTMEWGTAADLDILWCDAGCNNFVGNFNGATGANPEASQVTLGAGSYNLWINVFDDAGEPVHLYKLILTRP
jgi:hypothetical protein